MTPYEHERFQRELRGDFSEIDHHIRSSRIMALAALGGIALGALLIWLFP